MRDWLWLQAWEGLSGRQRAAAELLGYEAGDFEGQIGVGKR